MSSNEKLADDRLTQPSTPTTAHDYSRSVSQDLRHLNDALTHAIDQLTTFNSETMSDLSLKYELMRNNEVTTMHSTADERILTVPILEPRDWILCAAIDDPAGAEATWTQRWIP